MPKRNFGFPAPPDDPLMPASEPAWGPIRDATGEIIAFARGDHQAKMGAAEEMLVLLKRLHRKGGLGLDVHESIAAAIAKAEGC